MKRHKKLLVLLVGIVVCASAVAWVSAAAFGSDPAAEAKARVQAKVDVNGVEAKDIAIKDGKMTVALDLSKTDPAKPDTAITLHLFRAASEENVQFLDYSIDGRPVATNMRVPTLDKRSHVDATQAQADVTAWVQSAAAENKVLIDKIGFTGYRLDLTVTGDISALQTVADIFTNGGVTLHEKGELDYLQFEAYATGQLSYKADFDYELGIRVQWKGPGFEGDF